MNQPTTEEFTHDIELLVASGRLIFFRDAAGVVRGATAEFAAAHNLTSAALPVEEVRLEISAQSAEMMGEWN